MFKHNGPRRAVSAITARDRRAAESRPPPYFLRRRYRPSSDTPASPHPAPLPQAFATPRCCDLATPRCACHNELRGVVLLGTRMRFRTLVATCAAASLSLSALATAASSHGVVFDSLDGVTSSALLFLVLRAAGATVENFLPLRMDEGYGLSADGVARCLQQHRPKLLIAVDCGTSSRASSSRKALRTIRDRGAET